MPGTSLSVMCMSICGCPALRATTLSSREIFFLFVGKLYVTANGQRVRQEAADEDTRGHTWGTVANQGHMEFIILTEAKAASTTST